VGRRGANRIRRARLRENPSNTGRDKNTKDKARLEFHERLSK